MKKANFSISQITSLLRRIIRPVSKHFSFMYLVALLVGTGACVILIALTFAETDEAYRQQKQQEVLRDVQLNKDKATVDRILQLQTAGTGPIKPNYVPSRDNPFSE